MKRSLPPLANPEDTSEEPTRKIKFAQIRIALFSRVFFEISN
jgi:hypothetical protein